MRCLNFVLGALTAVPLAGAAIAATNPWTYDPANVAITGGAISGASIAGVTVTPATPAGAPTGSASTLGNRAGLTGLLLTDFYQTGDVDYGPALQRMINVASYNNLVAIIPAGTWNIGCPAATGQIENAVIPTGYGLTLEGLGHGVSILKWDAECATADLIDAPGIGATTSPGGGTVPPRADINFKDFSVYGNFMEGDAANGYVKFVPTTYMPFDIYNAYKVDFDHTEIDDMPYFGYVVRYSYYPTCDHCIARYVSRDAISFAASSGFFINEPIVEHDSDDAVSVFAAGEGAALGSARRYGVIKGGIFTDTQGINAACAFHLDIEGNIFDRVKFYPLYVNNGGIYCGTLGVNFSHNQILNPLDRGAGSWTSQTVTAGVAAGLSTIPVSGSTAGLTGDTVVSISSIPANTTVTAVSAGSVTLSDPVKYAITSGQAIQFGSGSGLIDDENSGDSIFLASPQVAVSGGSAPMVNNTGTGTITQPYPYDYGEGTTSSNNPAAGNMDIEIIDNQFLRTWNIGTTYASNGFGDMFTDNGWLNPTLTTNNIASHPWIEVSSPTYDLNVSGNIFRGSGPCMVVRAAGSVSGSWTNNKCYDFANSDGIYFSPASLPGNLAIDDSLFNGDEFLQASNRTSTASDTWSSASNGPYAIALNGAALSSVASLHNDKFLNVTGVFDTTSTPVGDVVGNTIFGKVAALGFSSSNGGVGIAPVPGVGFSYAQIDATTTDSAFGQVTTPVTLEAATLPASGCFAAGQYVKSAATPSLVSVQGWLRETTSCTNALDSGGGGDWIAVGSQVAGLTVNGSETPAPAAGTLCLTGAVTTSPTSFPGGSGCAWLTANGGAHFGGAGGSGGDDTVLTNNSATATLVVPHATTNVNVAGGLGVGSAAATDEGTGTINPSGSYYLNSNLLLSVTTPSVSSGFGTADSITHANGSAVFIDTVGTSPGSTATFALGSAPAASNGWDCTAQDTTNPASFEFAQAGIATTSVVIKSYSRTTGAAAAPAAGDAIAVRCAAF